MGAAGSRPFPPKSTFQGKVALPDHCLCSNPRKCLISFGCYPELRLEQLASTEAKLRKASDEQSFWEEMAVEAEEAKDALAQRLTAQQEQSSAQPKTAATALVAAANEAASSVQLDEAETRELIDQQLRQTGWTVDSANLRHSKGTRPERGKSLAIAEWPSASGPADYVLFLSLTPVAAVEAKRSNIDVSGALQQAKRYSRDFSQPERVQSPGGPWSGYRLPFVFSSNGRPYLRQLATRSGTWFCDLRSPNSISHTLDGWYSPEGLNKLLKRDEKQAHEILKNAPFDYGFTLRPYQQAAIKAVEAAIGNGQREMLLVQLQDTCLGIAIPSPLWGEGKGEGNGMRFQPPSPPSSPASGRGGKSDSQRGWLFLH